MKYLPQLNDVLVTDRPPKKTRRELHDEAIDLLKEEIAGLKEENQALKLRCLRHDKEKLDWARRVRGAEGDADVLFEALNLFAQVIDNSKREWRKVRETARRLLEDRGVPPPSTLGSSRNRQWKPKKTTEST